MVHGAVGRYHMWWSCWSISQRPFCYGLMMPPLLQQTRCPFGRAAAATVGLRCARNLFTDALWSFACSFLGWCFPVVELVVWQPSSSGELVLQRIWAMCVVMPFSTGFKQCWARWAWQIQRKRGSVLHNFAHMAFFHTRTMKSTCIGRIILQPRGCSFISLGYLRYRIWFALVCISWRSLLIKSTAASALANWCGRKTLGRQYFFFHLQGLSFLERFHKSRAWHQ